MRANPILEIWRISHLANYYNFPMYREFERVLGLSRAEVVVLFCLCYGDAKFAQDIVTGSGLPKNNISRAVRRLVAKRLISRRKTAGDRRRLELTPTRKGRDLLETCMRYAEARLDKAVSVLTKQERKTLNALTLKLCEAVPDWAEMEEVRPRGR